MSIFKQTKKNLESLGFNIISEDFDRPWGGFLVIDEKQTQEFLYHFFKGITLSEIKISGKLSPKILIVKPSSRLSWQYHNRRAEIWMIYKGNTGIIRSDSDKENKIEKFKEGDFIRLKKGERHRLVGLEGFCVVAEIWQHTDSNNPSDENDIIRVQDDFGRN